MTDPWERQEGEGDERFEAFVMYRDLGHERTIRRVATELDKSRTLIGRWSSEDGWIGRVAAWEAFRDKVRREAHLDEVREMSKRQAQHAQAIQQLMISGPVQALLEKMNDGTATLEFSTLPAAKLVGIVADVARIFPAIVNVERLARGEPTEITAGRWDVGSSLLEEEARKVRELAENDDALRHHTLYLLALHGPDPDGSGGGEADAGGAGDPLDGSVAGRPPGGREVGDVAPPGDPERGDSPDG